ncbi:MAG: hypothetical protein ACXQTR_04375 [Candidatus Methanospirareceae archaeon]
MVKGYSEYGTEHSKRVADNTADDLRKLGYGARVVPRSRWKGKVLTWSILRSDRKLKKFRRNN